MTRVQTRPGRSPSPRWLLVLALTGAPGCEGLEGALEAFAIAMLLALLAVLVTYAVMWVGFIALIVLAWRTKGVAAAVVSVVYALVLLVGHVVVATLHADPEPLIGRFEITPLESLYLATSIFPVAALLGALRCLVVAAKPQLSRGASWGLSGAGMVWLLTIGLVHVLMGASATQGGRIEEVSVAMIHACARLSDGRVMCVGANWDGQLGTGAEANRQLPALVRGIDDASEIAVERSISCALLTSEDAWCWGGEGEMHPPGEPRSLPWQVPGGEQIVSMSVEGGQLYLVQRDGHVVGWPSPAPRGLAGAIAVSHRNREACVVMRDGGVSCWHESGPDARSPTAVPDVDHAIDVAANSGSGCAVTGSGDVICWSFLRDGYVTRTIELGADEEAMEIVATFGFCARTRTQRVYCWGDFDRRQPTRIESHDGATSINAAGNRLCASRGDRAPVCVDLNGNESPEDADVLLRYDRR